MGRLRKYVWPVAFAYLVVVTALAALLITVGYLLNRVPVLPSTVERTYAAFLMSLLDLLLKPFDALGPATQPSATEADGRG